MTNASKTPIPIKIPNVLIGNISVILNVKNPTAVVKAAKNVGPFNSLKDMVNASAFEVPRLNSVLYLVERCMILDMHIMDNTGGNKLVKTSTG